MSENNQTEVIQWAQSLFALPTFCILDTETTGLDDNAGKIGDRPHLFLKQFSSSIKMGVFLVLIPNTPSSTPKIKHGLS